MRRFHETFSVVSTVRSVRLRPECDQDAFIRAVGIHREQRDVKVGNVFRKIDSLVKSLCRSN